MEELQREQLDQFLREEEGKKHREEEERKRYQKEVEEARGRLEEVKLPVERREEGLDIRIRRGGREGEVVLTNYLMRSVLKLVGMLLVVINRPGVAGAVLQTPL